MHPSTKSQTIVWALLLAVGLATVNSTPNACAGSLDLQGVDPHQMVPGAIEFYNEHAVEPLSALTADQIDKLAEGEVVVIRRKEGRAKNPEDVHHRVFGYLLIEQPLEPIWLAGMHPEYMRNETFIFEQYSEDGLGGSTAYIYVRTPWPFSDRHSVMVARMSVDMAQDSDGWIWEQRWDLAEDQVRIAKELVRAGRVDGVDEKMVDKGTWLPVNYGTFALFRFADELTLLGWSLTTSVGGVVPDEVVAAFAAAQLDDALSEVAERASWIESVYVAEDFPIYDAFGKLIPSTADVPEKPDDDAPTATGEGSSAAGS